MKGKLLLKFYFNAASLESALNGLSLKLALDSGSVAGGGEAFADRLISVIEEKKALGDLWSYLHGVISALTARDVSSLKFYAELRTGVSSLGVEQRRELHRAVMKFTRRARGVNRYAEGIAAVRRYYCLL